MRRLAGASLALAFAAAACGGEPPATPETSRGAWRYSETPADTRPSQVRGGGGAPSEAPVGPSAPAPAAPAAPAPSTTVARAPTPVPTRSGGYRVVPVANGGTVRGVVRIDGDVVLPPLQVTKDNERGCGTPQQTSERLVYDAATKGVGNVLVGFADLAQGKDWPEAMRGEARTVLVDQVGCRYVPHVLWARAGTQMVVANSDRADHNIHGYLGTMKDTAFNFSSEPGTRKDDIEQAFLERTGVYILKCDIHPWMSGYVHVVANPYHEVTSAQPSPGRGPGEFVLTEVPPGEHLLVVWKEGVEEKPSVADGKITAYTYSPDVVETRKVTVDPGGTATVEITLPVR